MCDLSSQAETHSSLGAVRQREERMGFLQQECQEKKTQYPVSDIQTRDLGVFAAW